MHEIAYWGPIGACFNEGVTMMKQVTQMTSITVETAIVAKGLAIIEIISSVGNYTYTFFCIIVVSNKVCFNHLYLPELHPVITLKEFLHWKTRDCSQEG